MKTQISLPEKHLLSKSTFMYGCQCPKRLWLHKFMPEVRDEEDETQAAIFQTGTNIGILAQQRFPGGVDARPGTTYADQKSVVETAKLIANGATIIYEAAFQFNGVLAAIDVLVRHDGKWYAYEVKNSTRVKDPHILDTALQYYVITNSGLPLEDIYILHLNREYVRYGDLDLDELFTPSSVLQKVIDLQPFIMEKELELKALLQQKTAPEIAMGGQCNAPYACDFQDYCRANSTIADEPKDYGPEKIDKMAIREFVAALNYPLYFLDFETWSTGVPEQDGHWPYRKVPFQFSLHIKKTPEAALEHYGYLAEDTASNLEEFVQQLIGLTGTEGSILVYYKPFENTILRELKEDFEQYYEVIEAIQDRLVDLIIPFKKHHYYLPAMEGSASIKSVLPALIPELSYDDLEIGNGLDASTAFYNLNKSNNITKIIEIRNSLWEYCKLDTLGMVRILEKLNEITC